jgi:hypothetical protein
MCIGTAAEFTTFSDAAGGVRVASATAESQPTDTTFRIGAEASGSVGASGSVRPGIAIVNTSTSQATVNFELMDVSGISTGVTDSLTIAGEEHASQFLNEIVPNMNTSFEGVGRITSDAPIAVTGLRGRYNARGDFLITTMPLAQESPATNTEMIFPHIVPSGGYTTQVTLFSNNGASSDTVNRFTQSGQTIQMTFD